jgi:hypothetical protein
VLALNLGLGTPLGFGGVEAQYNPLRFLGIAAGVGGNSDSAQVMLALRPRFPLGRDVALTASVGWSTGPHRQLDGRLFVLFGPRKFARAWDHAHWFNLDLGFELRPSDHFQIRTYFGITQLINVGAYRCSGDNIDLCENPTADYTPNHWYPYFGVAFALLL